MVILHVYHLYFSINFLLVLKCVFIFMNIHIRSFVYLIILVKMQCLNLIWYKVLQSTIVCSRHIDNFVGIPLNFSTNVLLFLMLSFILMSIQPENSCIYQFDQMAMS